MNSSVDEVTMGVMGAQGFDKAEDVWQSKQPLVTHLAMNQQPSSLAHVASV